MGRDHRDIQSHPNRANWWLPAALDGVLYIARKIGASHVGTRVLSQETGRMQKGAFLNAIARHKGRAKGVIV